MESPVEMRVFNKTLGFENVISDVDYYSFTPRLNGQGSAEVAVPSDAPINTLLRTPGTRLSCRYRGEHLMSGPLRTQQGPFVTAAPSSIYSLQDDWRILKNTLAWVNPAAPLEPTSLDSPGQAWQTSPGTSGTVNGQSQYYVWPASISSAEAAVKHLITLNAVTRLGRPITVLPNLDRGGNVRSAGLLPNIRFQSIAEAVEIILDWSGLILSVWQDFDTPTIFVDVREPSVWPQVITPDSGIITDGDWSRMAPDATRMVVGGPGQEAERAFWEVRDTTGLESEYGDIIEVFRDATGAKLDWPADLAQDRRIAKYFRLRSDVASASKTAFTQYLNAAGATGLAAGAPTSSLGVSLMESETFQFAGEHGIHLGDWLNASSNGIDITERITEASITLTKADGDRATPVLGKRSDDPDQDLWDAIAGVDQALLNIIRKR